MKKLGMAAALAGLLTGSLFGQMSFEKYNWKALSKAAQKKDQLIFVDAYASWCGPCKKMERDIFSLASVGDVYNQQFVLAKLDVDTKDGKAFSEKYEVSSIPNMFFLNAQGEVIHEITGATDEADFLKQAEIAQTLFAMSKGKKVDNLSPELQYDLILALAKAESEKYMDFLPGYLKTEHWKTEDGLVLIAALAAFQNELCIEHFKKNLPEFQKGMETIPVERIKNEIILNKWKPEIIAKATAKEEMDWAAIRKDYSEYWSDSEEVDGLIWELRAVFYSITEEKDKMWNAIQEMYKLVPSIENELVRATKYEAAADLVLEDFAEDKTKVQTAIGWAKQSEQLAKRASSYKTLAELHQALGEDETAQAYLRLAEELSEEE